MESAASLASTLGI